jgi:hypothetical protein
MCFQLLLGSVQVWPCNHAHFQSVQKLRVLLGLCSIRGLLCEPPQLHSSFRDAVSCVLRSGSGGSAVKPQVSAAAICQLACTLRHHGCTQGRGCPACAQQPCNWTLQCIGAPVGSLSNLQVARVLSANESSSSLCSPSVTAAAFTVHQQQCTCSANLAVVYSRVSIGTVQIVPDLWSL